MCVRRESPRDRAGLEDGAGVHRPGRDPGLLVPGAGPSCPWGGAPSELRFREIFSEATEGEGGEAGREPGGASEPSEPPGGVPGCRGQWESTQGTGPRSFQRHRRPRAGAQSVC